MKRVLLLSFVLLGCCLVLCSCGSKEAENSTQEVGMPNPWSEAKDAAEAAKGAGLDGFDLVEDLTLSVGEETSRTYRYMEGLAEAYLEFPASAILVRKGTVGEDGDVSGDYNTYAHTWTENFKGLEVTCFGNREGEATKTIWSLGEMNYSISAQGLGGDQDFGLKADDLQSIIMGLQ